MKVNKRINFLLSKKFMLVAILIGLVLRLSFVSKDLYWLADFWLIEDFGYSLNIAKNISNGLGETFDGVIKTNGYQPLYSWLNVPIYWFIKDKETALYIILYIYSFINILTVYIAVEILYKLKIKRRLVLIFSLILIFNLNFIRHGTNGLETGLVVFLLSLILYIILFKKILLYEFDYSLPLIGLLLGLFYLARIDGFFFILPVVFYLLSQQIKRKYIIDCIVAALIVLVIIGGYSYWNIVNHNYAYPTSGLVTTSKLNLFDLEISKLFDRYYNLIYSSKIIINNLIGITLRNEVYYRSEDFNFSIFYFFLLIILIIVYLCNVRLNWGEKNLILIAFMFYYLAFSVYTFSGKERYYLSSSFLLFILLALTAQSFFYKIKKILTNKIYILLVLSIIFLSMLNLLNRWKMGEESDRFGWKYGIDYLNKISNTGDVVGSLQTGNLGYFYENGRAINLDGVVNMDAYYRLKNGDIDSYIFDNKIKYLADEGSFVLSLINHIKNKEKRNRFYLMLEGVYYSNKNVYSIVSITDFTDYSKIKNLKYDNNWKFLKSEKFYGNGLYITNINNSIIKFNSDKCIMILSQKKDNNLNYFLKVNGKVVEPKNPMKSETGINLIYKNHFEISGNKVIELISEGIEDYKGDVLVINEIFEYNCEGK